MYVHYRGVDFDTHANLPMDRYNSNLTRHSTTATPCARIH